MSGETRTNVVKRGTQTNVVKRGKRLRLREAGIKRNVQELNVLNFGLKASTVMDEKLLTPEQVAERLQVTERTVYGWLRRGKLPALKLGRLWRIRPEDLEAFLESARTKAQ